MEGKKYLINLKIIIIRFYLSLIIITLFNGSVKSQVSQCIFSGTVQIEGILPQAGSQIILLGKDKSIIRNCNYQPSNGSFGVSAFSSDGLVNGDSVFFKIIADQDTVIAQAQGNPPIFQGNILPNPPNIINLVLFYLAPPFLLQPLNNSTGQSLELTLTWSEKAAGTSYIFQISKNSNFSSLITFDSSLSQTYINIKGLDNLTKYYWRVKAKNSTGTSDWSTTWSFTTLLLPPDQTVLDFPLDNSINNPLQFTFLWSRTNRADTYTFQISSDSSFTKMFYADSTVKDTIKFINNFQETTKYFWRVKANNASGFGLWSNVWSFSTLRLLPDRPILKFPDDKITGVSLNISLIWLKANNADSYQLQISLDSLFSNLLYSDSSLTDTTRLITALNEGTRYFWRVKSINTAGKSDWSDIWSYTTLINLPAKPILNFPSNKSKKNIVPTNFSWQRVSKANFYKLEISSDSLFTKTLFSDTLITDTVRIVNKLTDGSNYFWRISAKNKSGEGVYSDIWKFSTVLFKPDSLKAIAIFPHRIVLTWLDRSENERGYFVEKKIGDPSSTNKFKVIAIVKSNITSYSDSLELKDTTKYTYQVKAFNEIDSSEYSNIALVKTLVGLQEIATFIPKDLMLYQNYPNPFNPSTTIQYDLPQESRVNFSIYNVLGEKVEVFINKIQSSGSYKIIWHAKNLSTGIYFGRLNVTPIKTSQEANLFIKMFLIK